MKDDLTPDPVEAALEVPLDSDQDSDSASVLEKSAAPPPPAEELLPEEEFPEDHGEGTEVPASSPLDFSSAEFPPLAGLLEALLFTSQKPMGLKEILSILRGAAAASPENPDVLAFAKVKEAQVREAVAWLEHHYSVTRRSFQVRESAAGWQLVTRPDFAPWLRQLFPENRPARLSAPALETLAIIAYRQPITRADLEAVRGVAVDGVMQTLLDRGLIKIAGRADVPGRPLLYETTQHFMEHFGLRNLDELPNAQELRTVSLPTSRPPQAEKTAEVTSADAAPIPSASEAPPPQGAETDAESAGENSTP